MLVLNKLVLEHIFSCRTLLCRTFTLGSAVKQAGIEATNQPKEVTQPNNVPGKPVKFTTSQAHMNYKATTNFYSDDKSLPRSHNFVIASTGILGMFYLIFLRDDPDADGGFANIKPVHEQLPELAIPLLKASIAENRKFGADVSKLEKKLAEYQKEPEKYGLKKRKLVEN